MTQQSKEEKKETEVQPAVPNWIFPALPDKFTQQVPVSSKKPIKSATTNEKQHE